MAKAKKGSKKKNKLKKILDNSSLPAELRARPELHKFWHRRYDLFSRFNAGIQLDTESWFSVTPETIANHIAERCKTDGVILDAFCGCGGNTIQFAKHCSKVIAVDIDPVKIEYCRNNAKIYGVEDKIEFIVGDFTKLYKSVKADIVFLSPPWGGPSYTKAKKFNIQTMIPLDGIKLFRMAQEISKDVVYFLPRNVNRSQVLKLAGVGNYVDIEKNLYLGKINTITAYYGSLVNSPLSKTENDEEDEDLDTTAANEDAMEPYVPLEQN